MTSQTHPPLLSDKDGYLGLLNDPSQMTFLLEAWALARRILLIERSVEALVVMLSTKWDDTDAGELPGDVTLLRGAIRGFLSHNQPQFISSMSLDDWGSTRAIWPHHIHLKHSHVISGGTIEFATPPRLAVPGGGCGRPVKRLGQEVVPGEGGWCYEDMVYGGKVLARGLDTGAGDLVHEQNVAYG
ncbi:uncharacterized protein MKK02DRAFT_42357 [Dioszegia hungarica]|uniref:Uncharacterized protein n=1 Tax=Dioszegia hungarica TaxID=4972 RepID=A0AA38HCC4_9TREE|nr:uncharacterized protein MKK02DRAFT_42357 [Dioszegia hungarica]KAI9637975.1 hypothetical protein MKK02DRAFT_42357 [Dioszegia hungarica]